jgi:hypothetical protein
MKPLIDMEYYECLKGENALRKYATVIQNKIQDKKVVLRIKTKPRHRLARKFASGTKLD